MTAEEVDTLAFDIAVRCGRIMGNGFPWQRKELALLNRAQNALGELARKLMIAEQQAALREERFRTEVSRLTARMADAIKASGFENNGFVKLGGIHDDAGTVKGLLKALDLIGDGIGGDVGFAVSEVANQARMSAENIFDAADCMMQARKAVTP